MTLPAPPTTPRSATRWERMSARVMADAARARAASWVAPAAVTLLAAVLRLTNLGHPHEIMFDETYYVKDAWSLWNLGYEGKWGEGADAALPTGDDSAMQTAGSYVVHPPLGKWIIALGMAVTGPGSSTGWRVTTALLGALTVLVLYLITLHLTRSRTFATIAGGLLAIDGLGIVMSRIALLDGILTFFLLLGFLFVLLDRDRSLPLLDARIIAQRQADADDGPVRLTGPVLWARPWLVAAGIAFGAASAVKWSGLYALAGFGRYAVVTDALARRRPGLPL